MMYYPQSPSPTVSAVCCSPDQIYTLRVEGRGRVSVQPDLAEVLLGVTTENQNLTIAQQENAAAITAVINTLRQLGVPAADISTQSYTITPQYDFVEGQQVFRGYQVVHTLRVIIRDLARIGQIIDAAVSSGANFVSNIQFTVANPSAYYQQALTAAINDAISKAMAIGQQFHVYVSPVPFQVIEETYVSTPMEPALMKAAPAPTPIQVGTLDITAQVQVIFTYR